MSQGTFCRDPKRHRGRWYVVQFRCNHSAFNGGRRTPSAYSEVVCPECPTVWRTKAKYVDDIYYRLRDA